MRVLHGWHQPQHCNVPSGILLRHGHGLCNTKHLMPRRILQQRRHYVSNCTKLHCLRRGLLPWHNQHVSHIEPLLSGVLLRLCFHKQDADSLFRGQLLRDWVCFCNTMSSRHVLSWRYCVGGTLKLLGLLEHGLLSRCGQRNGHLQPVHCWLLLLELLGWHAASVVPRGLLVRRWSKLGDDQHVWLQHVLPWRCHGRDVERLHRLRIRNGHLAGFLLVRACHTRNLVRLVYHARNRLWRNKLCCISNRYRI